ncbi:methyltransferase family protein [Methanosphaerula palustris]|uniref:Isoprenylcysteine carboxyl methyltransferase n=1 Tax=Methanosphaerula palustris (strain ATCC BAA-1556 / DSM 19958 / E1-9c) TaxID=521011 RepID=B8GK32_METPE|nr:isoprenylcysteine carboxylmethyltransferase family protein [Methanosphaerula palustris]ACL17103.1 Isoprenylcysteine carboxyl methyltransferase [Methanosphaerula palustris E1-9c]
MVIISQLPISASGTEALLFTIAFFGWMASEIIGAMIFPRLRRYREGTRLETKDRRSGLVVIFGLLVAIYLAFGLSLAGVALLPGWLFYPGIALMVFGVFLRQWSIALLGGFFSALVSVQEGQTIIRKGPYRYVRHPSYTGGIMIMIGIGVALLSWGAVLVLLLASCGVYGYRIHVEEKALVAKFGDEYRAYMNETKMLIPFLL